MEQMKKHPMMRIYGSFWGRLVLVWALVAVLLSAFSAVQTVSYLTNDDNAIAYTLAGYNTGAPSPYALFINCLLGFPVSALYTSAPGVAWWAVLQLAAIAVSAAVIGACMLRAGQRRGAPLIVMLAGFALLLLLLLLQPVVEPTYTVTAAVIGTAGCALVVCAAEEPRRGKRIALDVLSCALLLLAFLYREETGFALLCFYFAACAYRAFAAVRGGGADFASARPGETPDSAPETGRAGAGEPARAAGLRRRGLKRACALFFAALIVCMAAFWINNALQTAYHGAEYRTFFHYRERFTDYPRDTFLENPALYESVGWDEALYDLADHWCFMDARINAASLQTITSRSAAHPVSLVTAVADCVAVIDDAVALRMTAAFLLCAGMLAVYAFWRDKRRWPEAAAIACVLLGGTALCLLLGLRGRFLARTFRVIAIPACTLAALLIVRMYEPHAARKDRAGFVAFAAIAAVLAVTAGLLQSRELRVNSPKYLLAESRAVTDYALAHPENVYFRDTYVVTDVDATTTYPDEKPINLISWGGCEMRSETSRRQLAANGLTDGYAEVLLRPNVYLITRTDSAEHAAMARYFDERFAGARLALFETLTGEIAVYRVEPAGA